MLRKWLISRKLNPTYSLHGSLSKILETPALSKDPILHESFTSSTAKRPGNYYLGSCASLNSTQQRPKSSLKDKYLCELPVDKTCEDIKGGIHKLSLTSRSYSLDGQGWDSFSALLTACGQSVPSTMADMLLSYRFVILSFIIKWFVSSWSMHNVLLITWSTLFIASHLITIFLGCLCFSFGPLVISYFFPSNF